MSRLEVDEVFFAYIVMASHAMSLVPVYYVSKSLHVVEVRYLPLEKAILAVVHVTCKLPYYFHSYLYFRVLTTQGELQSGVRS